MLHTNTVAEVSAGAGWSDRPLDPFLWSELRKLGLYPRVWIEHLYLALQKLKLQGFEYDIGRSSELWTLWDTLVKMPMEVWKVGGQQDGRGQSVITEQCLLFYFCSKTANT